MEVLPFIIENNNKLELNSKILEKIKIQDLFYFMVILDKEKAQL